MKKYFIFWLPAFFLLASCKGDKADESVAENNPQINATVLDLKSRMTNDMWSSGDSIGIYMMKSGGSLFADALISNIQYVNVGDTKFLPKNEANAIEFPSDGSKVDFISYYPYTKDIATDLTVPVDVSDQTDQAAIDLLFSNNAIGLKSGDTEVNLFFRHQLSKVVLNISSDNPSTDLSRINVKISNREKKANFSLKDSTLTGQNEIGDIPFKVSTDGKTAEAILLPSADLSGCELSFSLGEDNHYTSRLKEGATFEKMRLYTYNIILQSGTQTAAIANSNIGKWITQSSEDFTLLPGNETPGDGTQENPYTVLQVKEHDGENDVWVKGYIVGYAKSDKNYFIMPDDVSDAKETNILLGLTPAGPDLESVIPVQLPDNKIRENLNIKNHPERLGKSVIIQGDLDNYLGKTGVINLKTGKFQ